MMPVDYTLLTEVAGTGVTEEGRRMILTRYGLAASHAVDCDVLEVGAGAGIALGWYARNGKRVVGTDFTPGLVRQARDTYGARVGLASSDAQALPFRDASFDLVVFYEAIYYLADVNSFVKEARRVLRPGGRILVCTANKHRPGFVKSPYSHAYHDGDELLALLAAQGFTAAEVQVAFPAKALTFKQRVFLGCFSVADSLHLIPRTLEGRARIKRLLYGTLTTIPRELVPEDFDAETLSDWRREERADWKVIYATAKRE